MDIIRLVFPTPEMEEAAMDYVREHFEIGVMEIHGDGGLDRSESYGQWLEKINGDLTYKATPGRVPATTYFGVRESDGRIVGTIQIRHSLNEWLLNYAGHIGYGVRPSERRKGYATQMLGLALVRARELGLDRVLVTCDTVNTASAATIRKNGGVLENEILQEDGEPLQRYWIDLS